MANEPLLVGANLTLKFVGVITNPPSTSPISSVKIFTFSDEAYAIAEITSTLSIQMTTPTTLSLATYQRDSDKNNDLTSYTFTIKQ